MKYFAIFDNNVATIFLWNKILEIQCPSHSALSCSAHQPSPPAFLPGSPSTVEKLSELAALQGPLSLNKS